MGVKQPAEKRQVPWLAEGDVRRKETGGGNERNREANHIAAISLRQSAVPVPTKNSTGLHSHQTTSF